MPIFEFRCRVSRIVASLLLFMVGTHGALWNLAFAEDDWSAQQLSKLPASEKPNRLFNGKDFTGWEGQIEKYWSVKEGIIVAKHDAEHAPKASTYLTTTQKYRNFRLIFESKLVTSEMHSGISLWGQLVEKEGDKHSYQGHLVMYPSGYGYWDLYRRNSIYKDDGRAKKAGKQHDWNRMEILAIGNRIRHVINGQFVADWTDPQPELCQAGPIGLQLHSNKVAQEVQFRGLILTENPEDKLVTVDAEVPVGETSAKPDAISARMKEFVRSGVASGVVTLVAKEGRVVHHGAVGDADLATHRPIQPNSLFAIASMTKPISATALMMLVDEGKVSLSDPASKFIPEFKDAALKDGVKPSREITVRDLLTHTSGLGGDQKNEGTLAESAVVFAKRPLAFEPGSKWQYSPAISVCGRIVEVASGKPFTEFLNERLFQPLKMTDTTFNPSAEQKERVVKLYEPGKDGGLAATEHWINDLSKPREPNPSGGLFSTANDLFRFYQMILNGGELDGKRYLSQEAVQQMTSLQTGELSTGFVPGSGWGLGWIVVRQPQGVTEPLSIGTFGHGGAFGTQGWVDPRTKMVHILLIQRAKLPNADGSELRGAFHKIAADTLGK